MDSHKSGAPPRASSMRSHQRPLSSAMSLPPSTASEGLPPPSQISTTPKGNTVNGGTLPSYPASFVSTSYGNSHRPQSAVHTGGNPVSVSSHRSLPRAQSSRVASTRLNLVESGINEGMLPPTPRHQRSLLSNRSNQSLAVPSRPSTPALSDVPHQLSAHVTADYEPEREMPASPAASSRPSLFALQCEQLRIISADPVLSARISDQHRALDTALRIATPIASPTDSPAAGPLSPLTASMPLSALSAAALSRSALSSTGFMDGLALQHTHLPAPTDSQRARPQPHSRPLSRSPSRALSPAVPERALSEYAPSLTRNLSTRASAPGGSLAPDTYTLSAPSHASHALSNAHDGHVDELRGLSVGVGSDAQSHPGAHTHLHAHSHALSLAAPSPLAAHAVAHSPRRRLRPRSSPAPEPTRAQADYLGDQQDTDARGVRHTIDSAVTSGAAGASVSASGVATASAPVLVPTQPRDVASGVGVSTPLSQSLSLRPTSSPSTLASPALSSANAASSRTSTAAGKSSARARNSHQHFRNFHFSENDVFRPSLSLFALPTSVPLTSSLALVPTQASSLSPDVPGLSLTLTSSHSTPPHSTPPHSTPPLSSLSCPAPLLPATHLPTAAKAVLKDTQPLVDGLFAGHNSTMLALGPAAVCACSQAHGETTATTTNIHASDTSSATGPADAADAPDASSALTHTLLGSRGVWARILHATIRQTAAAKAAGAQARVRVSAVAVSRDGYTDLLQASTATSVAADVRAADTGSSDLRADPDLCPLLVAPVTVACGLAVSQPTHPAQVLPLTVPVPVVCPPPSVPVSSMEDALALTKRARTAFRQCAASAVREGRGAEVDLVLSVHVAVRDPLTALHRAVDAVYDAVDAAEGMADTTAAAGSAAAAAAERTAMEAARERYHRHAPGDELPLALARNPAAFRAEAVLASVQARQHRSSAPAEAGSARQSGATSAFLHGDAAPGNDEALPSDASVAPQPLQDVLAAAGVSSAFARAPEWLCGKLNVVFAGGGAHIARGHSRTATASQAVDGAGSLAPLATCERCGAAAAWLASMLRAPSRAPAAPCPAALLPPSLAALLVAARHPLLLLSAPVVAGAFPFALTHLLADSILAPTLPTAAAPVSLAGEHLSTLSSPAPALSAWLPAFTAAPLASWAILWQRALTHAHARAPRPHTHGLDPGVSPHVFPASAFAAAPGRSVAETLATGQLSAPRCAHTHWLLSAAAVEIILDCSHCALSSRASALAITSAISPRTVAAPATLPAPFGQVSLAFPPLVPTALRLCCCTTVHAHTHAHAALSSSAVPTLTSAVPTAAILALPSFAYVHLHPTHPLTPALAPLLALAAQLAPLLASLPAPTHRTNASRGPTDALSLRSPISPTSQHALALVSPDAASIASPAARAAPWLGSPLSPTSPAMTSAASASAGLAGGVGADMRAYSLATALLPLAQHLQTHARALIAAVGTVLARAPPLLQLPISDTITSSAQRSASTPLPLPLSALPCAPPALSLLCLVLPSRAPLLALALLLCPAPTSILTLATRTQLRAALGWTQSHEDDDNSDDGDEDGGGSEDANQALVAGRDVAAGADVGSIGAEADVDADGISDSEGVDVFVTLLRPRTSAQEQLPADATAGSAVEIEPHDAARAVDPAADDSPEKDASAVGMAAQDPSAGMGEAAAVQAAPGDLEGVHESEDEEDNDTDDELSLELPLHPPPVPTRNTGAGVPVQAARPSSPQQRRARSLALLRAMKPLLEPVSAPSSVVHSSPRCSTSAAPLFVLSHPLLRIAAPSTRVLVHVTDTVHATQARVAAVGTLAEVLTGLEAALPAEDTSAGDAAHAMAGVGPAASTQAKSASACADLPLVAVAATPMPLPLQLLDDADSDGASLFNVGSTSAADVTTMSTATPPHLPRPRAGTASASDSASAAAACSLTAAQPVPLAPLLRLARAAIAAALDVPDFTPGEKQNGPLVPAAGAAGAAVHLSNTTTSTSSALLRRLITPDGGMVPALLHSLMLLAASTHAPNTPVVFSSSDSTSSPPASSPPHHFSLPSAVLSAVPRALLPLLLARPALPVSLIPDHVSPALSSSFTSALLPAPAVLVAAQLALPLPAHIHAPRTLPSPSSQSSSPSSLSSFSLSSSSSALSASPALPPSPHPLDCVITSWAVPLSPLTSTSSILTPSSSSGEHITATHLPPGALVAALPLSPSRVDYWLLGSQWAVRGGRREVVTLTWTPSRHMSVSTSTDNSASADVSGASCVSPTSSSDVLAFSTSPSAHSISLSCAGLTLTSRWQTHGRTHTDLLHPPLPSPSPSPPTTTTSPTTSSPSSWLLADPPLLPPCTPSSLLAPLSLHALLPPLARPALSCTTAFAGYRLFPGDVIVPTHSTNDSASTSTASTQVSTGAVSPSPLLALTFTAPASIALATRAHPFPSACSPASDSPAFHPTPSSATWALLSSRYPRLLHPSFLPSPLLSATPCLLSYSLALLLRDSPLISASSAAPCPLLSHLAALAPILEALLAAKRLRTHTHALPAPLLAASTHTTAAQLSLLISLRTAAKPPPLPCNLLPSRLTPPRLYSPRAPLPCPPLLSPPPSSPLALPLLMAQADAANRMLALLALPVRYTLHLAFLSPTARAVHVHAHSSLLHAYDAEAQPHTSTSTTSPSSVLGVDLALPAWALPHLPTLPARPAHTLTTRQRAATATAWAMLAEDICCLRTAAPVDAHTHALARASSDVSLSHGHMPGRLATPLRHEPAAGTDSASTPLPPLVPVSSLVAALAHLSLPLSDAETETDTNAGVGSVISAVPSADEPRSPAPCTQASGRTGASTASPGSGGVGDGSGAGGSLGAAPPASPGALTPLPPLPRAAATLPSLCPFAPHATFTAHSSAPDAHAAVVPASSLHAHAPTGLRTVPAPLLVVSLSPVPALAQVLHAFHPASLAAPAPQPPRTLAQVAAAAQAELAMVRGTHAHGATSTGLAKDSHPAAGSTATVAAAAMAAAQNGPNPALFCAGGYLVPELPHPLVAQRTHANTQANTQASPSPATAGTITGTGTRDGAAIAAGAFGDATSFSAAPESVVASLLDPWQVAVARTHAMALGLLPPAVDVLHRACHLPLGHTHTHAAPLALLSPSAFPVHLAWVAHTYTAATRAFADLAHLLPSQSHAHGRAHVHGQARVSERVSPSVSPASPPLPLPFSTPSAPPPPASFFAPPVRVLLPPARACSASASTLSSPAPSPLSLAASACSSAHATHTAHLPRSLATLAPDAHAAPRTLASLAASIATSIAAEGALPAQASSSLSSTAPNASPSASATAAARADATHTSFPSLAAFLTHLARITATAADAAPATGKPHAKSRAFPSLPPSFAADLLPSSTSSAPAPALASSYTLTMTAAHVNSASSLWAFACHRALSWAAFAAPLRVQTGHTTPLAWATPDAQPRRSQRLGRPAAALAGLVGRLTDKLKVSPTTTAQPLPLVPGPRVAVVCGDRVVGTCGLQVGAWSSTSIDAEAVQQTFGVTFDDKGDAVAADALVAGALPTPRATHPSAGISPPTTALSRNSAGMSPATSLLPAAAPAPASIAATVSNPATSTHTTHVRALLGAVRLPLVLLLPLHSPSSPDGKMTFRTADVPERGSSSHTSSALHEWMVKHRRTTRITLPLYNTATAGSNDLACRNITSGNIDTSGGAGHCLGTSATTLSCSCMACLLAPSPVLARWAAGLCKKPATATPASTSTSAAGPASGAAGEDAGGVFSSPSRKDTPTSAFASPSTPLRLSASSDTLAVPAANPCVLPSPPSGPTPLRAVASLTVSVAWGFLTTKDALAQRCAGKSSASLSSPPLTAPGVAMPAYASPASRHAHASSTLTPVDSANDSQYVAHDDGDRAPLTPSSRHRAARSAAASPSMHIAFGSPDGRSPSVAGDRTPPTATPLAPALADVSTSPAVDDGPHSYVFAGADGTNSASNAHSPAGVASSASFTGAFGAGASGAPTSNPSTTLPTSSLSPLSPFASPLALSRARPAAALSSSSGDDDDSDFYYSDGDDSDAQPFSPALRSLASPAAPAAHTLASLSSAPSPSPPSATAALTLAPRVRPSLSLTASATTPARTLASATPMQHADSGPPRSGIIRAAMRQHVSAVSTAAGVTDAEGSKHLADGSSPWLSSSYTAAATLDATPVKQGADTIVPAASPIARQSPAIRRPVSMLTATCTGDCADVCSCAPAPRCRCVGACRCGWGDVDTSLEFSEGDLDSVDTSGDLSLSTSLGADSPPARTARARRTDARGGAVDFDAGVGASPVDADDPDATAPAKVSATAGLGAGVLVNGAVDARSGASVLNTWARTKKDSSLEARVNAWRHSRAARSTQIALARQLHLTRPRTAADSDVSDGEHVDGQTQSHRQTAQPPSHTPSASPRAPTADIDADGDSAAEHASWRVRVCVNENLPAAEAAVLRSLNVARIWGQLVVFPYAQYEGESQDADGDDAEDAQNENVCAAENHVGVRAEPGGGSATAITVAARADAPKPLNAAAASPAVSPATLALRVPRAPRAPLFVDMPPHATPLSLPFPPPSPRALHQLRLQLSYLPCATPPLSLLPQPPPQPFSEAVLSAPCAAAHHCDVHALSSSHALALAAPSPFTPPLFTALLARTLGHARAAVVHLAPDFPLCLSHEALAGAMALLHRPPINARHVALWLDLGPKSATDRQLWELLQLDMMRKGPGVCFGSLWSLEGVLAEMVITISCVDLPSQHPHAQHSGTAGITPFAPTTTAPSASTLCGNWGSAASFATSQCRCGGPCVCGRTFGPYFSGLCACLCVEELVAAKPSSGGATSPGAGVDGGWQLDTVAAHALHVRNCCERVTPSCAPTLDTQGRASPNKPPSSSPRGPLASVSAAPLSPRRAARASARHATPAARADEHGDHALADSLCSSLEASWSACTCACAAVNACPAPKSIHVCGCVCHHPPAPHLFPRTRIRDGVHVPGDGDTFVVSTRDEPRMVPAACDVWLPLAYSQVQTPGNAMNVVGRKPVTTRIVLPALTMFFLYRMQIDLSLIETLELASRNNGQNKSATMDPWWLMSCPGPALKLSVYDYNM